MIINKININVHLPVKNITNQYTEDQLSVEYQAPHPRQITMPAASHQSLRLLGFYRPDALPAIQPTALKR